MRKIWMLTIASAALSLSACGKDQSAMIEKMSQAIDQANATILQQNRQIEKLTTDVKYWKNMAANCQKATLPDPTKININPTH